MSIKAHSGPHGLSASVDDDAVSLSWTAPSDVPITGYRILSGTSADDIDTLVENTGSTAASYTDTSEHAPGRVHYAVAAHIADGTTRQSAPVSVQIPDDNATGTSNESVVLVSNAGSPASARTATLGSSPVAQRFRTGPAEQGYALHSVQLNITPKTGAPAISAAIRSDESGSQGTTLHALTGPTDLDADVDVFTAPDDAVLKTDTAYWPVIRRTNKSGTATVTLASSRRTDLQSIVEGTGYLPTYPDTVQLDLNEGGREPLVFFRDAATGITAREDAGHAVAAIQLSEPIAHASNIRMSNFEGTASRHNDYFDSTAGGLVDFPPGITEATLNAGINNNLQFENTEYFELEIFIDNSARTESATRTLQVNIEDDDTAELAPVADNTDVKEGDNITINVRPNHPQAISACHIPFAMYARVAVTGDTSALVDSAAQT